MAQANAAAAETPRGGSLARRFGSIAPSLLRLRLSCSAALSDYPPRLLSRAPISEAVPRDASPYITVTTTYFGATHDARAGQFASTQQLSKFCHQIRLPVNYNSTMLQIYSYSQLRIATELASRVWQSCSSRFFNFNELRY